MELMRFNKNEREEICSTCNGAGLYRGKICPTCNAHGKVLVRESIHDGDLHITVHDYEPRPEVQRLIARGVIV